jgi:hypothetical protein
MLWTGCGERGDFLDISRKLGECFFTAERAERLGSRCKALRSALHLSARFWHLRHPRWLYRENRDIPVKPSEADSSGL